MKFLQLEVYSCWSFLWTKNIKLEWGRYYYKPQWSFPRWIFNIYPCNSNPLYPRPFTTTPEFSSGVHKDCEISFTGIYVVVTGLRAHNARIIADLPSVEIWAQWCLYKMLAFKATLDKIGSGCSFSPLFPASMFWDKISFTPHFSEGLCAFSLHPF